MSLTESGNREQQDAVSEVLSKYAESGSGIDDNRSIGQFRPEKAEHGIIGSSMTISGYELQELLGAGGYGEVWKAIGPGGLPKAVKILFGEVHGQQAETELKSLERMKELRHPFLLSIERIEVVQNRVIVVSELADSSVEARFRFYRERGKPGIPRDELLGYLRDAADALDFMFEEHGLQHLDIKPDNLLLQGRHVKVGDFGLAKDVKRTQVSMINGFTPLYAPPELFEGRPGRNSDQYSLAIVYQAMLTGRPPFNGRTAAHLTAQHLRSRPDLTALQPVDRPVVSRALSKNQHSRFENCRTFVEELSRRRVARVSVPAALTAGVEVSSDTALVNTVNSAVSSAPDVDSLPVPTTSVSVSGRTLRPTVYVGVGGLGCMAVAELARRPSPVTHPEGRKAFPTILVDSDRTSLRDVASGRTESENLPAERVEIPLRTAKEYRSASGLDLSWLSRRWLFNIPRSGQVEEIRPLGRLALYDNRDTVRRTLTERIREATSLAVVRSAASSLHREFEADAVDIVVVSSTMGGTGSGCVADVCYLAREAACDLQIGTAEVRLVLLHGAATVRQTADVQEANAVSLLSELRHLSLEGTGVSRGFGDRQLDEQPPADSIALFHLGNISPSGRMHTHLRQIASFLSASCMSDAAFDFHAWRKADRNKQSFTPELRSVGHAELDLESFLEAAPQAARLASDLLAEWVSPDEAEPEAATDDSFDTRTLIASLQLTHDTLPRRVISLVKGEVGGRVEAFASSVLDDVTGRITREASAETPILDILADCVQQSSEKADSERETLFEIIEAVQDGIRRTTRSAAEEIENHVREQLLTPARLTAARRTTDHLRDTVCRTQEECCLMASQIEESFRELCGSETANSTFRDASGELDISTLAAFTQQYCLLVAYQAIYRCFVSHVSDTAEFIRELRRAYDQLAAYLQTVSETLASRGEDTESTPSPVLDAFDSWLRTSESVDLASLLISPPDADTFAGELQEAAAGFIVTSPDPDAEGLSTGNAAPPFPASAWPGLRNCGGRRRVLAMIPAAGTDGGWESRLQQEFGDCVAKRPAAGNSIQVTCEIEGIPLDQFIAALTNRNNRVAEVARRIHTRIDVDW